VNIVELFANIGLKADTAQAERFLGTTKAIQSGLIAAGAAATGFMVALNKITREATAAALEFQKFETDTGGSAQALQRWQAVAEQTSGAGAAVAASIRAISLNQEKIKMGQGNLSGYQLLGIDPTSDPFEVLEALRTKTTGLSQAMKRNIMAQFGISTDLLATVDLTSEAFDRLAGKAFVIDPGTIAQINKARAAGTELAQAMSYIKAKITANLAPAMVELSNAASDFIRLNKDEIMGAVKKIFEWIVRFSQAIGNAAMMINKIVQGTIGWGNALKIIIGLVALLNAAFLTSPLGLFISGIVLLIALLDDIMVYQSGKGRSLMGVLFEKFPSLEAKIKPIGDAFMSILTALDAIFGDQTAMEEITEKWGAWSNIVRLLSVYVDSLKNTFKLLFDAIFSGHENINKLKLPEWLNKLLGFDGDSGIGQFFRNILEYSIQGGVFGDIVRGATGEDSRLFGWLRPKERPEAPSQSSTTIQNNITVTGARDPAATGAAVENAVTGAMRRAEQRLGRTESR
jgi:hypothetical protein